MAETATVIYKFRMAMRHSFHDLDQTVRVIKAADEGLAGVIDTLPTHLQPDTLMGDGAEQMPTKLAKPWIKWQRFDLTLVLLHLRVRINRTLQDRWLSASTRHAFEWARTISVTSAMSIIWINRNWDQPISMRKQW